MPCTFEANTFLLTYAQDAFNINTDFDTAKTFFQQLGLLQYLAIGVEQHQSGDPHWHAIVYYKNDYDLGHVALTSGTNTPTSKSSGNELSTGLDVSTTSPRMASPRTMAHQDILASPCGAKSYRLRLERLRQKSSKKEQPEISSSTEEILTTRWIKCTRCRHIARFSLDLPRPFAFQTTLCDGCRGI